MSTDSKLRLSGIGRRAEGIAGGSVFRRTITAGVLAVALLLGFAATATASSLPAPTLHAVTVAPAGSVIASGNTLLRPQFQVGVNNGHFWVKLNRLDLATGAATAIVASCTATFGIAGLSICGSIMVFARSQMYANQNASGVWVEVWLFGMRGGTW